MTEYTMAEQKYREALIGDIEDLIKELSEEYEKQ